MKKIIALTLTSLVSAACFAQGAQVAPTTPAVAPAALKVEAKGEVKPAVVKEEKAPVKAEVKTQAPAPVATPAVVK